MAARNLEGPHKLLFKIVSIAFSGIFFLHAAFRIMPMEVTRPLYLGASSVLAFMLYPMTKKGSGAKSVPWYDYILIILIAASMAYWNLSYFDFAVTRLGQMNMWDFWFGIIAIILMFETARRVLGIVIPIVSFAFMAQLHTSIGPWLPGTFGHRGFSLFRIIDIMYRTDMAIFGSITHTFATFVVPFLLMGAFMEVSGASNFFIRMSMALTKGWVGGPAKVAVIGSAIVGSVQGSSVSNVVTTGVFTIPMMKRVGYSPEHAGAIEATASNGGMLLPPVMGAGAFLMASMTDTPYVQIAIMSLIPAILYYYWCLWSVHSYAKKNNIKNVPDSEIPDLKETLKEGWFFIVPILLVFVLLVMGWSPDRAALGAILSCIVFSQFTKNHKIRGKNFLLALETAGKNNVSVGAMIGALGIIMGGIILAGLAQKFGFMVVMMSGGVVMFAILLVGIVAVIIGMGSPQTAAYMIMAMIVVPGLVLLGVNLLTAHLIAFWFSALASVTPPVAVAAMAASSISGGNPMRTGLVAAKYSMMIFVLPFAFHYFPGLLVFGTSTAATTYITIAMLISIPMLSCGLFGFFIRSMSIPIRLLLALGGLMFFIPADYLYTLGLAVSFPGLLFTFRFTDLIGVAILIVVVLIQKRGVKTLNPVV